MLATVCLALLKQALKVRVGVCLFTCERGINTAGCDVSGLLKRKWCRAASTRNHVFFSSRPKTHAHTHTHTVTLNQKQLWKDKSLILLCLFKFTLRQVEGFYEMSSIEKNSNKLCTCSTTVNMVLPFLL